MKKFSISTAVSTREVNANEYSVAPKTNVFSSFVRGVESFAASTAGKGKSAIPNFYLYFRDGATLYYFRSTPEEIAAARASGFAVRDPASADELGEPVEAGPAVSVSLVSSDPSLPKGKRSRAKA